MFIPLHWITWLIIGAVAGWLAGVLVKGSGYGLVGNVVIGIIGSFVGGWLFSLLRIRVGPANSLCGSIVVATIGAVVLIGVVRLLTQD